MASFDSRGPRPQAGLQGSYGAGMSGLLEGALRDPAAQSTFAEGEEFDVARMLSDAQLRGIADRTRAPTEQEPYMGDRHAAGTKVQQLGGDAEDMDALWEMVDPGGKGMAAYREGSELREIERQEAARKRRYGDLLMKMQAKGMSKREMNRVLEANGYEKLGFFD